VSILYLVQEHASSRIEPSDVPRGDAEVGVWGLFVGHLLGQQPRLSLGRSGVSL